MSVKGTPFLLLLLPHSTIEDTLLNSLLGLLGFIVLYFLLITLGYLARHH